MKLRWNIKGLLGAFLIAFVLSWRVDAQVIINEVSASNSSTIYDEDGDTPDWIELLNTSDNPILLSDYYLSDKKGDLLLYRLPEITLSPNDLTYLFASEYQ